MVRWFQIAGIVLVLPSLTRWPSMEARAAAVAAPEPCRNRGTALVVRTIDHTLTVCQDGRAVQSFGVRLGRGGTGKTRSGDRKTPMGTYDLGTPRPSRQYGTFIPIGYPSAEQRRRGYTGSAVGIHGPARTVRWLGRVVNWMDTSDGCVGLATDEEMSALAQWVRRARPRLVHLE